MIANPDLASLGLQEIGEGMLSGQGEASQLASALGSRRPPEREYDDDSATTDSPDALSVAFKGWETTTQYRVIKFTVTNQGSTAVNATLSLYWSKAEELLNPTVTRNDPGTVPEKIRDLFRTRVRSDGQTKSAFSSYPLIVSPNSEQEVIIDIPLDVEHWGAFLPPQWRETESDRFVAWNIIATVFVDQTTTIREDAFEGSPGQHHDTQRRICS